MRHTIAHLTHYKQEPGLIGAVRTQNRSSREAGVSPLIVLAALFVLAVVVLLGIQLFHRGADKPSGNTPAASSPSTAKGGSKTGSAATPTTFTAIPAKLDLHNWKVHMIAPAGSTSKLVYKYQPNELVYVLSTRSIVNDSACVDFYNRSISPPGLRLEQFGGGMRIVDAVPGLYDDGSNTTINNYYQANKAPDGNYFIGPNNDDDPTIIESRWYKVGNNFYTIQMPSLTSSYVDGFAASCTHEAPGYYNQFEQMLTTIQAD